MYVISLLLGYLKDSNAAVRGKRIENDIERHIYMFRAVASMRQDEAVASS